MQVARLTGRVPWMLILYRIALLRPAICHCGLSPGIVSISIVLLSSPRRVKIKKGYCSARKIATSWSRLSKAMIRDEQGLLSPRQRWLKLRKIVSRLRGLID